MKWEEFDLAAKVWEMPGSRTKRSAAFSAAAADGYRIVAAPPVGSSSGRAAFFPALTRWTDDQRALSDIHQGAYRWKDLRRTVSTRLAARGFSEEVIGRTLNDARYTVTARHYIRHAYLAETRHALEAWRRNSLTSYRADESPCRRPSSHFVVDARSAAQCSPRYRFGVAVRTQSRAHYGRDSRCGWTASVFSARVDGVGPFNGASGAPIRILVSRLPVRSLPRGDVPFDGGFDGEERSPQCLTPARSQPSRSTPL